MITKNYSFFFESAGANKSQNACMKDIVRHKKEKEKALKEKKIK